MRWFWTGCMVLGFGLGDAWGQTRPQPILEGTPEDAAFLSAAREELSATAPSGRAPFSDPFLRTVSNEMGVPPEPGFVNTPGPGAAPTPGYGYHGVSNYNLSTDPDSATVGIRLDKAFAVLRDVESVVTFSEHQNVFLAGGTILPIQTPCWVWGVRTMGGYTDQLSMTSDSGAYSIDSFFGTRYKKLYHKIGFFIDDFDRWKKLGLAYSALTTLPIVGTVTFDSAFGFRSTTDELFPDDRNGSTFRSRRVEQSDADYQFRVGKFWNEYLQTGVTGNYYPFTWTDNEWGAGAFANIYVGRFRIGGDVTGGNEGLRGYLRIAMSWGVNPAQRMRDCRVSGADTVGWVTRATDRDPSIRMRESYTGPLPIVNP